MGRWTHDQWPEFTRIYNEPLPNYRKGTWQGPDSKKRNILNHLGSGKGFGECICLTKLVRRGGVLCDAKTHKKRALLLKKSGKYVLAKKVARG